MLKRSVCVAVCLTMSLALGGCASHGPAAPTSSAASRSVGMVQSGQVTDVRDVVVDGGQASGVGGFLGSIAGAILGSQIGSGWGSTAASIGGSIAGGAAGNAVERNGNQRRSTQLTVRLDNGEHRQLAVGPGQNFQVGEQVRIVTENGVSHVVR